MSPSVHAASAGAAVLVKRAASSNGFYNNLFYILIAVLGAFVFTAVVNFLRTRRRRRLVFAEAARLDLMVPGLPGYVPMRERPALVKADGWRTPSWWEVVAGRSRGVVAQDSTHSQSASQPLTGGRAPLAPHSTEAYGADGDLEVTDLAQLRPLALVPLPLEITEPPKPLSPLKFFPNYVSYPKSAHTPKPPRFAPSDPAAFDCIVGEPVDVLVAVRMPRPPTIKAPIPPGEDDDAAVMDEWGGVEIGVATWTVTKDNAW